MTFIFDDDVQKKLDYLRKFPKLAKDDDITLLAEVEKRWKYEYKEFNYILHIIINLSRNLYFKLLVHDISTILKDSIIGYTASFISDITEEEYQILNNVFDNFSSRILIQWALEELYLKYINLAIKYNLENYKQTLRINQFNATISMEASNFISSERKKYELI